MIPILYFFITHKKNLKITYQNKIKYLKYAIIICGGNTTYYNNKNRILYIECNDYYEGLPEKIIKTLKFLSESPYFSKYTHFVKLDEDMEIKSLFYYDKIKNIDYGGNVQFVEGNRKWHLGKCSINSNYNKKEYEGPYVPWCKGGYGYIISRRAINLIKDNKDYNNHIYEDLYLALILREKGIYPIELVLDKFIS